MIERLNSQEWREREGGSWGVEEGRNLGREGKGEGEKKDRTKEALEGGKRKQGRKEGMREERRERRKSGRDREKTGGKEEGGGVNIMIIDIHHIHYLINLNII